jgi:glutamyl-tRNA reductase
MMAAGWWNGWAIIIRCARSICSLICTSTPTKGAVRHILRVASGLDSLVLGEPQILGQVKAAYQVANSVGALGVPGWSGCSSTPSAVAKQVRTDTRIGASPVSVAFAAVGLAKQIFADLPNACAPC